MRSEPLQLLFTFMHFPNSLLLFSYGYLIKPNKVMRVFVIRKHCRPAVMTHINIPHVKCVGATGTWMTDVCNQTSARSDCPRTANISQDQVHPSVLIFNSSKLELGIRTLVLFRWSLNIRVVLMEQLWFCRLLRVLGLLGFLRYTKI